ncbi:EamA/RhaT family transporter [Streptomyces uncialis]|uniref:EamA/RhaT family transporter n=1 Tax=Streptomyces uncialis TaxID=1048205 RepID=UPI00381F43A7
MSEPPTPVTGPRPAPLRFFGTTWVRHDGHYGLRRAGVATGSLTAAFSGCLVLRFAHQGLAAGQVGPYVNLLVLGTFALCSALAFRRTWTGFRGGPDPGATPPARATMALGFLGTLLAYFLRSLAEAPGEKRLRARYEEERAQHVRRVARRTGNPAKRGPG